MIASEKAERTESGVETYAMHLAKASDDPDRMFTKADLVFLDVDHSGPSYEVRVFLNNPDVDPSTPRDRERGYAGRFVVFGHGGCYGDEGHCDVPESRGAFDLRPAHGLVPQKKVVTISHGLEALEEAGDDLKTVTLVPVLRGPSQADARFSENLLRFSGLELRTYR